MTHDIAAFVTGDAKRVEDGKGHVDLAPKIRFPFPDFGEKQRLRSVEYRKRKKASR